MQPYGSYSSTSKRLNKNFSTVISHLLLLRLSLLFLLLLFSLFSPANIMDGGLVYSSWYRLLHHPLFSFSKLNFFFFTVSQTPWCCKRWVGFLARKMKSKLISLFNSSLRRSQGNHFLRTWLPTEMSSPPLTTSSTAVVGPSPSRTPNFRCSQRKQDWTSVCTLLGVSVGACLALALNPQVYNFWEVQRHSRLFYFQTKNMTIFCRHSDYSQPECSQLS